MNWELLKKGVTVKTSRKPYVFDKALVINDSHGDVLICETRDGFRFPIHKQYTQITSPWLTKEQELKQIKKELNETVPLLRPKPPEAPKQYHNTIKKRADKGTQQSLF